MIQPLDNFTIMQMMDKYKNFIGVFSRDNTEYLKKNQSLILNLDDETGNGTHWCAICKSKTGNTIFYFDSYGFPPPQEIVNMYKKHKNKIMYSNNEIQMNDSIMCGYYCVQFIKEMYKGKSFYDFLYQFDVKPSEKNEFIVKKYFDLI